MPLEIREAQLCDAAEVARLLLELGHEDDEGRIRRRLDRVLRSDNQHVVLVAEEPPHGVIGLAHAMILATLLDTPSCEVCALIVTASHRQMGAGRALVERIHGWALRRGVENTTIRVSRQRKEAQQFLDRLGYTKSMEERVYTRDLTGPTNHVGENTMMD